MIHLYTCVSSISDHSPDQGSRGQCVLHVWDEERKCPDWRRERQKNHPVGPRTTSWPRHRGGSHRWCWIREWHHSGSGIMCEITRVCGSRQVPDQYGTIRAVSEGKGEEFLVGTSRNFILRGTFNDGFLVVVQVRISDVAATSSAHKVVCLQMVMCLSTECYLWCVQGHTDELWGLASHPFRDMFLTCAQDRLVCLWNSVDHSLQWSRTLEVSRQLLDGLWMVDMWLTVLSRPQEHGHCADFHPSGAVVAIGTHSGK